MNHATLGNREKINAKSLSSTYSELKELHSCRDEKPAEKKYFFIFNTFACQTIFLQKLSDNSEVNFTRVSVAKMNTHLRFFML